MSLLLHITRWEQWEQARREGVYRADSLAAEGFIHCSKPRQALLPANALFRGQTDLVLLCIDADRVRPDIRYEGVPGGEAFPHLYGPLNLDAVVKVLPFPPQPDGTFTLPPGLPTQ